MADVREMLLDIQENLKKSLESIEGLKSDVSLLKASKEKTDNQKEKKEKDRKDAEIKKKGVDLDNPAPVIRSVFRYLYGIEPTPVLDIGRMKDKFPTNSRSSRADWCTKYAASSIKEGRDLCK